MFSMFKKIATNVVIKTAVKMVSKGNPYALAAVEVYDMYNTLSSKLEDKSSFKDKEKEGKVKLK